MEDDEDNYFHGNAALSDTVHSFVQVDFNAIFNFFSLCDFIVHNSKCPLGGVVSEDCLMGAPLMSDR